jgi:hypothetical protein
MNSVISTFKANKGLGFEDRGSCVFQDIDIPAHHNMISSKNENKISYKLP